MAIKQTMTLYICEKCGKAYRSAYVADMCCKQYHCEVCGVETERYMLMCPSCYEKAIFEKARKLTLDEYEREFPGHMLYWGDSYYADIDELLDYCEGNDCDVPEYVFGTCKVYLEIDPDAHLEMLEEDINCEDIRFCDEAWKEYKEFVKEWNEKYREYCFFSDNSIIVMIPQDEHA